MTFRLAAQESTLPGDTLLEKFQVTFEPAPPPPEGGALSPELRGLGRSSRPSARLDRGRMYQSGRLLAARRTRRPFHRGCPPAGGEAARFAGLESSTRDPHPCRGLDPRRRDLSRPRLAGSAGRCERAAAPAVGHHSRPATPRIPSRSRSRSAPIVVAFGGDVTNGHAPARSAREPSPLRRCPS